MQAVWNAYCDTLINEKDNIAELKTLLSQKEERIHVLEEQIIQYRNTVEKIRESIDKLGE
jgi:septal ring factor EnvC (AmiA/AmiB activator)